jgi:hypothetical protein
MAAELPNVFEDLLEATFGLAPGVGRDRPVGFAADVAGNDNPVADADRAGELGLLLEARKRRYALSSILRFRHDCFLPFVVRQSPMARGVGGQGGFW